MKLSELRKELKVIGYKVKTESLSWGRHATFTNDMGKALPSIFTGEATRNLWLPLINYRLDNEKRLAVLFENEKIYGLIDQ